MVEFGEYWLLLYRLFENTESYVHEKLLERDSLDG